MKTISLKIFLISSIIIITLFGILFASKASGEGECTVQSLKIDPHGEQSDSFWNATTPPTAKITLETTNCVGKVFRISGTTNAHLLGDITTVGERVDVFGNSLGVKIPDSGTAIVDVIVGTMDSCDGGIFGYGEEDCGVQFSISGIIENGTVVSQEDLEGVGGVHFSEHQLQECWSNDTVTNECIITFTCDSSCNIPWRVTNNPYRPGSSDIVLSSDFQSSLQTYDGSNDPCWDPVKKESIPNCYVPISGLRLYDLEAGGEKILEKIDENVTVGDYLNSLFAFAIGVAGVLGVIMIVFYAYQYLTSASAGAKVELRNNILQVLLGIVLLLGIFTILKTINPDLLILDPFVPEAASVPPGTPGTATAATGPGKQMTPVPGGVRDILQSVTARTTENANNTLRVSVTATLKPGTTLPTNGLELQMGTSATSLSRKLDMSYISGGYSFLGDISITTPEKGATWHYKLMDTARGEAVKLSAVAESSTSSTSNVSCTGQTPDPENNQQLFQEWVENCYAGDTIDPLTTQNGQSITVKPCDSDDLVTVSNVFGGKSFVTHKTLVPAIERISQKWNDADGASFYPINTIGGYNCRWLTGSTSVLSNHSYGLAIDVNYATNPYIPSISSTIQRSQYTDMPEAFVKLWTDEGFGWGGNWTSKKDAMHFSKIQNEGGNAIVDNI